MLQLTQSLKNTSPLTLFISVSLFGFIGVFVFLSQNVYLADTEIWAINFAQYSIKNPDASITLLSKSAFYALLKSLYFSYRPSWVNFKLARMAFAFISLFTLLGTYLLSLELTKNKKISLLSLLILISTSFFLSRGYRVRSDILATSFFIYSALIFLYLKNGKIQSTTLTIFASLGIMSYSLMATPKAIFLGIALVFFVITINKEYLKNYVQKNKLEITILMTLVLSLISFILIYVFKTPAYKAAWVYFENSFQGRQEGTVKYLSISSFYYLFSFLKRDWLFSTLFILSLIYTFYPSFKKSYSTQMANKSWRGVCIILLIIFIFFPDKLPFYWASLLPIFSVGISIFLVDLIKKYKEFRVISTVCFLAISIGIFHTSSLLKYNNNNKQELLWKGINNYLSNYKEAIIYDGIGLFPNKNRIEAFPGPGLSHHKESMVHHLKNDPPDIVILSERMGILGSDFFNHIKMNYSNLGHGLWGLSYKISDPNQHSIEMVKENFLVFFEDNKLNQNLYIYPNITNELNKVIITDGVDAIKNGNELNFKKIQSANKITINPFFTSIKVSKFKPLKVSLPISSQKTFGFDRKY